MDDGLNNWAGVARGTCCLVTVHLSGKSASGSFASGSFAKILVAR